MGFVEVGGDGSVHWRVDHEKKFPGDHTKAENHKKGDGENKIPPAEIGEGSGNFRLEVIYDYPADAQAALNSVVVQGSTLVLYVKSNTAQVDPVPAQVRVKW